jgi:hypothetical protein
LVAVAWGWESKYNNTAASGNSGWFRWYWAYASPNGILIPFQSGNCFCYGRDSVTLAGISELSDAFTISRSGNAWRMKLAVAWYGANGQVSTAPKVYNVPLFKRVNNYWYWGVNNVFEGTVAP